MERTTLAALGGGLALPGHRVGSGGVAALETGEVSHASGRHVHTTPEVFMVLEGRGEIRIEGRPEPYAPGDVLVVAPGEDHHLHAAEPTVVTWLHMEAR